jgi:LPXTG-site transpeptidase (sortase) family protein
MTWLLAAALLLLVTLLFGTASVAWAELRRPDDRTVLDPARYDVLLDVPGAPSAEAVRFGVGPRSELPSAVLRIPRLQIEVAVHPGTSAEVLFRGAGTLAGSALPGDAGHVGLALHRDRHFRRLGELALGDSIALDTADRTHHYRVTRLWREPAAHALVFAGDADPVLTLVTSHPFHPAGRAAPRLMVRAELVQPRRAAPLVSR